MLGGHGLFTWGATSKACYETTLAMINKAVRVARRQRARARRSAAPPSSRSRLTNAAMSRPSCCRRSASASRRASARSDISPTRRKCWNSSIRATCNRLRRSAPPAPIISCARRSARWCCPSIPSANNLDAVVASLDEALAAYRADYAAYYERCKRCQFAGDARSQRGHLSGARRRHVVVRQGQGDGAHRLANSISTPSTSCAAPRASANMSASPSRKRSTSNIGCWKRPSCSACRSRSRSRAASR